MTTFWRWTVVAGVLGLAIAPIFPLLIAVLTTPPKNPLWTESFAKAVAGSLRLGVGVAIVSLTLGLPLGLVSALYRFPGRLPLVVVQALPLLLPSFLLAIGWRNLIVAGWLPRFLLSGGLGDSVFVLGLQAVPLPFFATWVACRNLTASQIDAARLFGGEKTVIMRSVGTCTPVAAMAALLAGILSLTDPGATQVFGLHTAAREIRTSFASLGDKVLAAQQCLAMAGLALLLTAPVLVVGLRRLAAAVLAGQTRPAESYPHPPAKLVAPGRVALLGLVALIVVGIGFPTFGLCLPAIHRPMLGRAAVRVWDTMGPSLVYTAGAGAVAVLLALVVAMAAVGDLRLRMVTLAVFLLLLALPPALGAIGVVHAATNASPALDWLTRSQFTVALVLGLRFLPVAAVAMMRAVGSLSPSWTDAAKVHGVSKIRFFGYVIVPVLRPTILIAILLVMVLAAADVTTTHLLHPPGRQSLPLAIFTVMANSPEGLVASLCLLYLLGVVLLLVFGSQLPRWSLGRRS